MRGFSSTLHLRFAQLSSSWLPVFAWGLFILLWIGEQWAAQQRAALQQTLNTEVTALQLQQRQQHELALLTTGMAPYLEQRQSGTTEERIRRLASQQGLQLQRLEQTDTYRSAQRRTNKSADEHRLVFHGSLTQIEQTLAKLAAQLDAQYALSAQLQAPANIAHERRLELTIALQTEDRGQTLATDPKFWKWITTKPLQTRLGARNPFQAERIAIATSTTTQASPLTEHELNALLLVGTLLDPTRGQSRALFLLPDNRVISGRIGDAVGRERAKILAILPDAVDLVTQQRDSTRSSLRREHQRLTVHSAPTGPAP